MFDPGGRTVVHGVLGFYSLMLDKHMTLSLWAGPQYSTTYVSSMLIPQQGAGSTLTLPSQWTPAGGVMYSWEGSRTRLHAGYSRQISDGSGVAEAVTSQQADAEFRRRLAARWTARAGVSIREEQSPAYAFCDRASAVLSGKCRNRISHHRQPGSEHSLTDGSSSDTSTPCCPVRPPTKIACGSLSRTVLPVHWEGNYAGSS